MDEKESMIGMQGRKIESLIFTMKELQKQIRCLTQECIEKNSKIDNLGREVEEAKFVIKHLGNQ